MMRKLLTLWIALAAIVAVTASSFAQLGGGLMFPGPGRAAGGVSPATYAATYVDCQDLGFGSSTYTSASITWTAGTAIVFIANADGANTLSGVTIKGVAATLIGASANGSTWLYRANITSGSGTVTFTGSGVFANICTNGGVVTTTTSTPFGSQVVNCCTGVDPQAAAAATIPANGVGVAMVAVFSARNLPGVWSNATRDTTGEGSVATGNSMAVSMAHSSSAGSLTPSVSGTGGNGFGFQAVSGAGSTGQAFVTWGP
jgi:hypothetical protein